MRIMRMTWPRIIAVAALLVSGAEARQAPRRDFKFDRTITRPVLENYLSRAVTMMDLCTGRGDVDDNIRMLKSVGAKFAGRTLYLWGHEKLLPELLKKARAIEAKVHAADPEMILQAGLFEIVTTQVNDLPVPEHVFREYGLPPEKRNFRYEDMLFDGGKFRDHWHKGGSVPDMTKPETRLWFFHLAAAYVDAGMEAIHWGQIALIGARDKGFKDWWDTLSRARKYAAQKARRHLLICDAHTPDGGPLLDGKLLFDFHSFPLRIKEVKDQPLKGILEKGYHDSFFGRSKGGVTPSGWACANLPYLVEFDNWGSSGKGGQPGVPWHTWGYDEIDWFARQPEAERNEWLRYAHKWIRETDPNGFLQMPGSRILHDPVDGKSWYHANSRSSFKDGFNQEDAIRQIWAAEK
jgi:hypothetical protein